MPGWGGGGGSAAFLPVRGLRVVSGEGVCRLILVCTARCADGVTL